MRRLLCLPLALALLTSPIDAHAAPPPAGVIQTFGPNLRSACPQPEGLAVDPVGNLYIASVQSAAQGVICVINRGGILADRIPVTRGPGASNVAVAGMLFSPGRGLFALDVGDFLASGGAVQDGRLLRIDPGTHAVTVVVGGFGFPNGIAEDSHRNIYVSDSARGTIYQVNPGGTKTVWSHDSLISRHVNDLAFDGGHHFLYVVTTGSIVRIPLKADGSAGPAQVFADSSSSDAPNFSSGLFSDDGIALDGHGNVFLTAAATSEIFELSSRGKLISRYSGSGPDVLDQPSALVFHEQNLYITNTSQADGGLHARLSVLRALPQTRGVPGFLIHGQVTDSVTHLGIQGIDVNAVDSGVSCCPFQNLAFAQTDSSGNYKLLVPAGSSVKVQFFTFGPNAPPYVGQWWNNKPDFDTADTLTVNAETFNINAALARGVFVHGQVTDAASHAGIPGVDINAVDPNVDCCPFRSMGFGQTDANGSYQFLVPEHSSVKLQFFAFPTGTPPYVEQWWNNKPDFQTADTLVVNSETFGIDVALLRGVFIHGRLTDSVSHAGIGGMDVIANDASVPCCRSVGFTQSNADGSYDLFVALGSNIKIQFFSFGPNAPPYIGQWWDNKPDFDPADTLTVNAETFNINAALVRGVLVHGQVTDAASHAPIAGINVNATDPTVGCCRGFAFAQTDTDGNYQILVPVGSPVKLQFMTFGPNALPYFEQWWNNKPDFDTADTLTVNTETFNINAALTRGVFVHGQVTDAVSHAAIAGINVNAVDPSVQFHNLAFAQTDSGGNYQILVPTGGPVKLQFSTYGPGSPPYFERWWNNKPDFYTADTLTANVETFNIDMAMTRGAVVSGQVTDNLTHAPIAGIGVELSGAIAGCCGTSTDANGNYQLVAPLGSSVRVSFATFDAGGSKAYLRQWWNNKPTFDSADVLTMDGDKSGIDAALTAGLFVHGHVIDAVTHQPLAGIFVQALDSTAGCCQGLDFTVADSNGNYRLAVATGSIIKVQFTSAAGSSPYVEQWWNNKPDFDTADSLTVNIETFGIDAALAPG